jgi:hypothetical protein
MRLTVGEHRRTGGIHNPIIVVNKSKVQRHVGQEIGDLDLHAFAKARPHNEGPG